jgi:hypothetical protein
MFSGRFVSEDGVFSRLRLFSKLFFENFRTARAEHEEAEQDDA